MAFFRGTKSETRGGTTTEIEIVDDTPEARFKVAGLTVQLLPVGPPLQESATGPANPPSETTLAAYVAVCPAVTVAVVGNELAPKMKSAPVPDNCTTA